MRSGIGFIELTEEAADVLYLEDKLVVDRARERAESAHEPVELDVSEASDTVDFLKAVFDGFSNS